MAFQSNQLKATPLFQSIPIITNQSNLAQPALAQQYCNPYMNINDPYLTNNAPPMPVFPHQ